MRPTAGSRIASKKARFLESVVALVAVSALAALLLTNIGKGAAATGRAASDRTASAVAVAAGGFHSCALLTDGTVECWGVNGADEIGDGMASHGFETEEGFDFSPTPVQVTGIAGASAISAGGAHTCAFFPGGTVKCWGNNGEGELGNGTQKSNSVSVAVKGITNATQVSAGASHTCSLLSDGTVKCWGHNDYGQLGDSVASHGYTDEEGYDVSPIPVQVSGITDATAVSTGDNHACALFPGGTVKCWGWNAYGQLGNGTKYRSPIPVAAKGVTRASQVSAGDGHTCALLSGGTIKCWGNNEDGQLGNGKRKRSLIPVAVKGVTKATQVSAGEGHTCALFSGGTVKCWGRNNRGELGDGVMNHGRAGRHEWDFNPAPAKVRGTANALQISAGRWHTCALLSGGAVKCWGYNEFGELGNGIGAYRSTPVKVKEISNAKAVNAGGDYLYEYTCALISGGKIRCWGSDEYGQLGDAKWVDRSIPVAVRGIRNATQIAAGSFHLCVLLSSGTVKCWGMNDTGQLGNGTRKSSLIPVAVKGITRATQVSAGEGHSCALFPVGTVKCWGESEDGELGNGGLKSKSIPVMVKGIVNATQIAAGFAHTCALLDDGAVACWGYNHSGELGNGTRKNSPIPVAVKGIRTAVQIRVGAGFSCALLSGGTIRCWGDDLTGELGNGKRKNSPFPVAVKSIANARAISTGWGHACARLSNRKIKCWGLNSFGQLGNGAVNAFAGVVRPVRVMGIANARAISASGNHTCALLSGGAIKCWGKTTPASSGMARWSTARFRSA